MPQAWVEQDELKKSLAEFFTGEKDEVSAFGATVNQTFEAFVFAATVSRYRRDKWRVTLVHPGGAAGKGGPVKLKFNTRGRPDAYTFARCRKAGIEIQIRHNLRVATRHHAPSTQPPANVCLDVAVIGACDVSKLKTDDHVENAMLLTFAEAKHMSAFAELVANFLGLVHEMMPEHLEPGKRPYIGPLRRREHPAPFLYVSGFLNRTARGVLNTIRQRGLDVDLFDATTGPDVFGFDFPKQREGTAAVGATVEAPRPAGRKGGARRAGGTAV